MDFVFIMNTIVVWMTVAPTAMAMDSPLDLSLQIKCLDFFFYKLLGSWSFVMATESD